MRIKQITEMVSGNIKRSHRKVSEIHEFGKKGPANSYDSDNNETGCTTQLVQALAAWPKAKKWSPAGGSPKLNYENGQPGWRHLCCSCKTQNFGTDYKETRTADLGRKRLQNEFLRKKNNILKSLLRRFME